MQRFIDKLFIRFILWVFSVTHVRKRMEKLKPKLFWGPVPIINFKYWNEALKAKGYSSVTIMFSYSSVINKKEDYDLYFYEDILSPLFLRPFTYLQKYFPQLSKIHWVYYIVRNFDILHITCEGIIYRDQDFMEIETDFYKKMGLKIIVLPYGGDICQYSKILDNSFKYGLVACYPQLALKEPSIEQHVQYWTNHADAFMPGFILDGIGRIDVLGTPIVIDITQWNAKNMYNLNDGVNGIVKITHTPNHRGIKGTEYIIQAVNELKEEGLKIELTLMEKKSNSEVKDILFAQTDILAEEVIFGYGLSGIEGMCTGLPVLSNLNNELYTRVMYRFSFLRECPILSTTPENVKENIRVLVCNPTLRKELGKAGRAYAEKYHSYQRAQFMFEQVYNKIWYEKEVDLINIYHPLMKNSYNNIHPLIEHPLHENKLPSYYHSKLKD